MKFAAKLKRAQERGDVTCRVWGERPCWDCLRKAGITPPQGHAHEYPVYPHGQAAQ